MDTASSIHIEGGGQTVLHALDRPGPGLPIIFVHGLGAHAHWWDCLAPFFSGKHRTICLDLRGHGDSQWSDTGSYRIEDYAQDLAAFARKLDAPRWILAGHSLGARISLRLAAGRPKGLCGLVAIDFLEGWRPYKNRRFDPQARMRQPSYSSAAPMLRRFRLEPDRTAAPKERLEHLARKGIRRLDNGRWSWKLDWRAFRLKYPGVESDLKTIDAPGLIIRGEKSAVMSRNSMNSVADTLGAARMEISGAFHHVMLDSPQALAEAILGFTQSLPAGKKG